MKIREVHVGRITQTVCDLCIKANTTLSDHTLAAYREAMDREESPVGKDIFQQLLDNAEIAKQETLAVCQDTGMVVVFVEMGQEVHIVGGNLYDAVNQGVRQGYKKGFFRASTLDPLSRKNIGDNTPAVIHTEITDGDELRLTLLPKGFGGEMMSQVKVFHPAVGMEGVKEFIVSRVDESGGKPCPPGIVGVGIGGTLEKAAILAKKSLVRPIGLHHVDPEVAALERDLLERINRLGIGPQGLGGRITALAVHVETYPTHIASIPVAVNIQCHSIRHSEAVL